MRLGDILEKISLKTVELISIILFGLIVILSATQSAYLETAYEQKLIFAKDSILINLFFAGILFLILRIVANYINKNIVKRSKILLIIVMGYIFCICLGWAALTKCFPTADQASVYYGAKHFAVNYFESIAAKDSYFSCYPHQMGLCLFYEIIFRIAHFDDFRILQALNALFNCVTIFSLYRITLLLFRNKLAGIYFLLLSMICVPLIWYTPFVYGDLPSLALAFSSFWLLLEGVKRNGSKKSILQMTGSILLMMMACAIRKNTLIIVIGVLITLFVYLIKRKRPKLLIYLIFFGAGSAIINPLIPRFYEMRSGGELNEGVPSISHVVMGLQEGVYANGWYNGFNFETYAYEAGYDQEKAIEISKKAIDERVEAFQADPAYAVSFFGNKFVAEWLNTGYACFDFTAGKYYQRLPFIESFFSGKMFYIMRFFMDKYQFFIYLCGFLYLSQRFFKKKSDLAEMDIDMDPEGWDPGILKYTLLTAIIGGALFYLFWEGSGRYILPYFVMALPFAGAGLCSIHNMGKGLTIKR